MKLLKPKGSYANTAGTKATMGMVKWAKKAGPVAKWSKKGGPLMRWAKK